MGRPLQHDLTGRAFNDLTVIGRSARKAAYPYWVCQCTCGRVAEVASSNLREGHTTSCGCKTKERASASLRGKNTTHGLTCGGVIPAEYNVWQGMLKRCYRKEHHQYKNYGARGIKVCARWHKFENFLADMGERPSKKHSIERRNNDRGYSPSNCCWALALQQLNNKRTNFRVAFQGRTQTLAEWSRELNMNPCTLRRRLEVLGWSVERALTTPVIPPQLRRARVTGTTR